MACQATPRRLRFASSCIHAVMLNQESLGRSLRRVGHGR